MQRYNIFLICTNNFTKKFQKSAFSLIWAKKVPPGVEQQNYSEIRISEYQAQLQQVPPITDSILHNQPNENRIFEKRLTNDREYVNVIDCRNRLQALIRQKKLKNKNQKIFMKKIRKIIYKPTLY